MSKPYPFREGMNGAWALVAWRCDHEWVEIAVLDREDIAQVRGYFDRGDDMWMYNVYPVPNTLLPRIADLIPGGVPPSGVAAITSDVPWEPTCWHGTCGSVTRSLRYTTAQDAT
ncbi:hypothetical protein [Streptomyces violascens]|uniref:hypothetical protein n=1 Tax=Streptomyces violascens TaxID=67381 RepID=UPI003686EAAD